MLYRYRYIIAAVIFALCVALGLTGSSIGLWCSYLGEPDTDVLLGVSRSIRGDEWALFTPLAFAQHHSGFGYMGDLVHACQTDVFMEYGQAAWHPLVLFRPFFWGYLLLPLANGMAFFWCGRTIVLLLVAFEAGMLLTEGRKGLSAAFAILVLCAPTVQWWFAINGLVEMLVFTLLSVLLFRACLRETSFGRRIAQLAAMTVCAGGFALTLYPPWMIPCAYVLLALATWVFLENRRDCRMAGRDWFVVALAVSLLAVAMAAFCWKSREAIATIRETVYPGARVETGGGMWRQLFLSATNPWHALKGKGAWWNVCNSSFFLDFFPVCWILPINQFIRSRRIDRLSLFLLCASIFLGVYCTLGFPDTVAKATLLSVCQSRRVVVIFGFCNLLLLVRSLALICGAAFGKPAAAVIALATASSAVLVSRSISHGYLVAWEWFATAAVFFAIHFCLLHFEGPFRTSGCILAVMVALAGGPVGQSRAHGDRFRPAAR